MNCTRINHGYNPSTDVYRQERARAEIGTVLKESNGKLGMEELQSLTYIDCCVKETLRLYPSVPHVSRLLNEDLKLSKFRMISILNLMKCYIS